MLELCKNKERIKKERQEAKKIRSKIVKVGNFEDNYDMKFEIKSIENQKREGSQDESCVHGGYEGININQGLVAYDPYQSRESLSEKIGVILDDVHKVNDGDDEDTIKQKLAGNKNEQRCIN